MSLLATIESKLHALFAPFLSQTNMTIIAGQIAAVNVTHPDASGPEKQSVVAKIVAEIFSVGEAIAHALVKIVYDTYAKQLPAIVAPLAQVAKDALNSGIDTAGLALQAKATEKATEIVSKSPFSAATASPQSPTLNMTGAGALGMGSQQNSPAPSLPPVSGSQPPAPLPIPAPVPSGG